MSTGEAMGDGYGVTLNRNLINGVISVRWIRSRISDGNASENDKRVLD